MGNRITNFVVDGGERLIAANDQGLLYTLDRDLNVLRQSTRTYHSMGIHTVAADERWVYTRDVAGSIARWDKHTLAPVDFVVSRHYKNAPPPGITPMPVPSGAMTVSHGELYVANAYGQISVFDPEHFSCKRVMHFSSEAFPECINTENPAQAMISDVVGSLWRGDLQNGRFEKLCTIPTGNMHCVRYDRKHDRYWATSDTLGGVATVTPDGEITNRVLFTNDDVEEIAFSSDYELAYVGCFDHHVYVVANAPEPHVVRRIGPFKFQITHVKLADDRTLYLCLESGELYRVDLDTGRISGSDFGTNAVWFIAPYRDSHVLAMEAGNVEIATVVPDEQEGFALQRRALPNFGRGRVRKALPVADDGLVCITTDGDVVRCDWDGQVRWRTPTEGILRDIDVNRDATRAIACNEVGQMLELRLSDGEKLREYRHHRPAWCVAYDYHGRILMGERTLVAAKRNAAEPDGESRLTIFDEATFEQIGSLANYGNFKRIQRFGKDKLLINGNGGIRVNLFDIPSLRYERNFSTWMLNTPENAAVIGDYIYVVTYTQQILTYKLDSGELVSALFSAEGFPFSLAPFQARGGEPCLLVGGRNFLSVYSVRDVAPQLVRTWIL